MGFGLLFIGYATLLFFKAIPIELLGFGLAFLGTQRLEQHSRAFSPLKYACLFMVAVSCIDSVTWLSAVTKSPMGFFSSQTFSNIAATLYHVGLFAFHGLLYKAVYQISNSVGYKKGVLRAKACFGGLLIFYIAQLCASLIPGLTAVLSLPILLYQLIWYIYNLVMLYGCYAMIVTDEMLEKEDSKYNEYLKKHRKAQSTKKASVANDKTAKAEQKATTSRAKYKARKQ